MTGFTCKINRVVRWQLCYLCWARWHALPLHNVNQRCNFPKFIYFRRQLRDAVDVVVSNTQHWLSYGKAWHVLWWSEGRFLTIVVLELLRRFFIFACVCSVVIHRGVVAQLVFFTFIKLHRRTAKSLAYLLCFKHKIILYNILFSVRSTVIRKTNWGCQFWYFPTVNGTKL